MNTVTKAGVAGALALAGVAAHAQIASPSGSSSDAILFGEVLNAAGSIVVASYAGDTGVSINTLLGGSYTGTVLGSDSNLAKLFAADGNGDELVWAVQGAQNTQTTPTTFVTTTTSVNGLKNTKNGILANWAAGITADVSTINSNITTAGGTSSVEGATPATAGVWDITVTGTSSWYGDLTTQQSLGTTASLYSEVTNGTTASTKGIATLLGTVSLSASGLAITENSSPTPTPLPPAVWLLGSGLLGLAGVARRRVKA